MERITYYENLLEFTERSKTRLPPDEICTEKLCRTCLTDLTAKNFAEKSLCVVGMDGKILEVPDMFSKTVGFEVAGVDSANRYCFTCISKLSAAYFFKLQCQRADSIIKRLLVEIKKSSEENAAAANTKTEEKNSSTLVLSVIKGDQIDGSLTEDCDIKFRGNASKQIDVSVLSDDESAAIFEEIEQLDSEIVEENKELLFTLCVEEEDNLMPNENNIEEVRETEKNADSCSENKTVTPPKKDTTDIKKGRVFKKSNKLLCEICKREFSLQRDLILHSKTEHPEEKAFKCNECFATFRHLQSLHRHSKLHQSSKKNKMCSLCCKMFVRADDLKRHIRTHTNERPYECSICGKSFKQTSERKEHMLSHTKAKIYKCKICGRELASRNGIYIHMKVHNNIKEHKCSLCSKEFVTGSELKSHMNVHSGMRKKKFM